MSIKMMKIKNKLAKKINMKSSIEINTITTLFKNKSVPISKMR